MAAAGRNSARAAAPWPEGLAPRRSSPIRRFRARFEELIAQGARGELGELTQGFPCGRESSGSGEPRGWRTAGLLRSSAKVSRVRRARKIERGVWATSQVRYAARHQAYGGTTVEETLIRAWCQTAGWRRRLQVRIGQDGARVHANREERKAVRFPIPFIEPKSAKDLKRISVFWVGAESCSPPTPGRR